MKKIILIVGIALLLIVGVYQVSASVTATRPTQPTGYIQNYTFFNATTTSATSTDRATTSPNGWGMFNIAGAKNVAFYFSRADSGGNTGSSTFKVQVTPDGTNWYDYNTLVKNVATSSYPVTEASVVIQAATSTVISYMANLGFYGVRCTVVEAINGAHTCKATAEF